MALDINQSDLMLDLDDLVAHTMEYPDAGDHDVFAHYVEKDIAIEAVVNGWPVVALCGKIWIPYRDPEKYPICPICQEMFDGLMNLADPLDGQ